ncbi:TRAP transporter small permease subunit [Jannaschia aquimarina]|uniref:TRAP transporter small permease protein n=1 Tax=Jannaschia aquimarina TaxID=935700 RepID=A0A0D1EH96_9RHOB|nr:TRAP transporter small permease subunit [Jannaschia aquimarina]KIT15210.1 Tripartite ATP-independent periplasmic transporter, DctQ component [Jannaschia aquimarina]SNT32879.1 Tripartite ATP-independent transporter, DctQ component [Jannaschia aquimarina]
MLDAIVAFFTGLALAVAHLFQAIFNPGSWLAWIGGLNPEGADPDQVIEIKQSLMRLIYYGASTELFFVCLLVFLIITVAGYFSRRFLWGLVRGLEAGLNFVGRVAAWAGLLMVLQQTMIVFLQRIFRVSEISLGPFGSTFSFDLSWWSEELKLYNAMIVCLCVAWTFIQGGHVRVDLVYSAVSHRTKRAIDMFGSLVFMVPALVLIWLYSWFFFWRSMITPATSASDPLDRMLLKARAVRWNIETIGFSPNGFNAYFLFKVLILLFVLTALLQACAFFWRSWLEYREGEMSAGRYLDRDILGDETAEKAAQIH